MSNRIALLGLTTILAILLMSCGPGATPAAVVPQPTTAVAPTKAVEVPASTATPAAAAITRGGSLSWAYNPVKVDPIWSGSRTDQLILAQVIEGLVIAAPDASPQPGLSDKWTVSDDGLIYSFHLRAGVKFHNGKALTPEDVIASLERNRTMGTYKWSLAEVKSIEKADDSTVKITLNSKVASLLARLAIQPNAIFPKEEIDKIGKDEFSNPIGTGPFMFKEWVRNDHLTLDKNPNYWQMGADGKPLPYLDQLVFRNVPESTTQVLQVQAGSLNGSEGIPWSQIPALEKDPKGKLLFFPQQQIYFMVIQVTKPPFDDVKVRQAMSLALDRKVFVDRATAGKAEVANSFFPKSAPCWSASAQLPYDLDKAKQLMKESKYPNGFKGAKLQLSSGGQLGRDNAVIAQQMWSQIGIDLTIEEVEASALVDSWYKSTFEAISGYQWTNGMNDPEQHAQFFFVDPRMNTGYQPSQHAVDVVKAASQELDRTKRCQLYAELQDIYNTDIGGTISLYYTPSPNYVTPNVRDFVRSPLAVPYFKQTWLAK